MARPLAAALLVLLAAPAAAQVQAVLERDGGLGGVPVTVPGVAAAEEATALAVNPAGIGFVGALNLAWQHESDLTPGSRGDALFVADAWGPFGVGYAQQWIRPGEGGGDRWRKTTLGLTLGDGRSFSLGFAWNWFASPDADVDAAESWDVGLTWRPSRHLSLSVAALNRDLRVGAERLPVRYDAGLGLRLWRDALTVTADVIGDDQRTDDVRATHAAVGLGLETASGFGLSGQLQFPIRDDVPQETLAVFAFSWSGGHAGVSGGASSEEGWLGGARLSAERYRAPSSPVHDVPGLDLGKELEQKFFAFLPVGDSDRWGTLLERLAQLRDDPAVGGVVLRVGGLDVGAGRAEELRTAIGAVAARKPVLAYLEGRDTRAYWIASAATAVAVAPGAVVFVNGIGSSQLYLRDGLARLGVAFEVVKVGAWKSASEPLTRSGASPEAREATGALLDDVFGRLVADVAASRRLQPEQVRTLVDRGVFTAEEAREAGLVDAVLWPDELEEWARARTGARASLARYAPAPPRRAERWGSPAVVEVIRIEGAIVGGKSRDAFGADGLAGAETVRAAIRRAARDGAVKAIVLRIESPGGDGAAGDLIWREVVKAREKKPVVASMGDVAASAGYLVAVGADEIVAEPSTITGSIGVFALKPDLSGLLERLSVRRESYRRGENAELFSFAKPWTEHERAAVQRAVDTYYAGFVEKVAAGRKLTNAEVEAVAGGRVWSGRAARERRLVDRLGGLEDAVAAARERAGLGPDDAVVVRRSTGAPDDGLAGPVRSAVREAAGPSMADRVAALLPEARTLALLAEMGPVLALPVEWVAPAAGR